SPTISPSKTTPPLQSPSILAMSQTTPTLSSQGSASAVLLTPAAALVSNSLLDSAKGRIKDLMAAIPDSGTPEESDIEDWGKRFHKLMVCSHTRFYAAVFFTLQRHNKPHYR